MDELLSPLLSHLDHSAPGDVLGVYLYGSATTTGLRPNSDIDLLILTHRSLTDSERSALVSLLLDLSGWKGHAERFPDAADRQPLEVTSLVLSDLHPLTEAPRCDFQYGEWLREALLEGLLPQPSHDPDVVTLLAAAQDSHKVLRGPTLDGLLGPVPAELLRQALLAVVPRVIQDVDGDERNAVLTLARTIVTLETGQMVSKDDAAQQVAPRLTGNDRVLLERARAGYLGEVSDNWNDLSSDAMALAHTLAEVAQQAAPRQSPHSQTSA